MNPRRVWQLAFLVIVLVAANVFAWQPGVGGRRDGRPGTELERLFGWPATYRAELWESDDPGLAHRILSAAPLYFPSGEMQLRHRTVGFAAAGIDIGFALFACGLAVMYRLDAIRVVLRVGASVALAVAMLACYLLAQRASVHL